MSSNHGTSLLPMAWHVPDVFRRRLGTGVGRQRAMVAEGHLLLVLHAPPKPDQPGREGRFFWRSPDGKWTSRKRGPGINALKAHLDEYADVIAELEEEEERASSAEDRFQVLEHLAPLHRASRNLHQVLQTARESCPDDREIINLRDRAYDIERSADLLMSGTQHGVDFAIARRAEEQAQSSQKMALAAHRLNILAAFFFPIATLSAIFGVNLRHGMEETPGPLPFIGLIGVGLLTGAVLTAFVIQSGGSKNGKS